MFCVHIIVMCLAHKLTTAQYVFPLVLSLLAMIQIKLLNISETL